MIGTTIERKTTISRMKLQAEDEDEDDRRVGCGDFGLIDLEGCLAADQDIDIGPGEGRGDVVGAEVANGVHGIATQRVTRQPDPEDGQVRFGVDLTLEAGEGGIGGEAGFECGEAGGDCREICLTIDDDQRPADPARSRTRPGG